MRLIYAPRALRDIRRIAAHLREHNQAAANETLSIFEASIEKLTAFPKIGRVLNKAGLRRLPIPHTPYLVFYRTAGEDIMILHVRDGRRKPFPL